MLDILSSQLSNIVRDSANLLSCRHPSGWLAVLSYHPATSLCEFSVRYDCETCECVCVSEDLSLKFGVPELLRR